MNDIKVKPVKTRYQYEEVYWMIDEKPIVQYIDEYRKSSGCWNASSSMMGLLPAWSGQLLNKADNQFIWELIDARECLNVPILVCEDDCDLTCIVIMSRIRKEAQSVYWDKIGVLNHENIDMDMEKRSGILYIDGYTEEDWDKYGDNIAWETAGSKEFQEWISLHWDEELIRRRRNYTKPYMQRDENILWIGKPHWEFDAGEYQKAVEYYRNIYQNNGIPAFKAGTII